MRNIFVCSFLCVCLCFSVVLAQLSFPVDRHPHQFQEIQYNNQAQQFARYDSSNNGYSTETPQQIRFPNLSSDDQITQSQQERNHNLNQYGLNVNVLYVLNNLPTNNNENHNENTNHNYDDNTNNNQNHNENTNYNNVKPKQNDYDTIKQKQNDYDTIKAKQNDYDTIKPKQNDYDNINMNRNSDNDGVKFEEYRREDRHEDVDITNVENHQNVETSTNSPFITPISAAGGLTELNPADVLSDRNAFGDFHSSCRTVSGGSGTCVVIFKCRSYVGVLMQARVDAAARSLLKEAHCGFQGSMPKVCCPSNVFSTDPPPSNVPFTTTTTVEPVTTTTTTTQQPDKEAKEEVTEPEEVDLYDGVLPDPPVCGSSNASWSRVVGGIPAKLGDFPWMALLGYTSRRGTTSWLCGGTLITSRHVLSAAHCVHNHETDLTTIRLGELDLERDDEGATPVDIKIQKKIKHEDYNPKAFTNDIAILVLERTVTFTPLIKPVCIMKSLQLRSQSYVNYKPIIAGWGAIGYRKESAPILQVLQIPVVSNEQCAQSYASYKSQVIDERVLCAGYKSGGKDACQGDSGGPLLQPIYNPSTHETFLYQLGVVSYGKECALANFPGVYTRVTHFTTWIHDTVKNTMDL